MLQPPEQDLALQLSLEDRKLECVVHTHTCAEGGTLSRGQVLGTALPRWTAAPSHWSRHLINVTQRHILLH